MKVNENVRELVFINTKQFCLAGILSLCFYIALLFLSNKSTEKVLDITIIMVIMISLIMLLIINSIYVGKEKAYVKFIAFFYVITAFESIREIMGLEIPILKDWFGYNIINGQGFILCLISITFYFGAKYNESEKKHINNLIIVALLFFIINYLLNKIGQSLTGSFIFNLLTVYYCVKGYLFCTFFEKDKINIFSVGSIFLSSIVIMRLIYILLGSTNENLILLSIIVFIVWFITTSVLIIIKVLKNPYKLIFKELYDKNYNLNELNKIIVSKNRELEISQTIIKKNENTFKTFLKNIPIPFIILAKDNERIIFVNKEFIKLMDISTMREVINKKLISLIEIEPNFICDEERMHRGTINTKNEVRYADMNIIEINDDNNQVIITFIDVTSKVKVEKMKETMQNKLFEEKIKKDFLSNISHDLKTPINVIYSATQLMKYYIENNNIEGLNKYNTISKQNCLALTRFTNNLIDSSKIHADYLAAKLVIKNIVEVVEEVVTSLVDYAKNKNIDLIFDTDEEEIYAKIDVDFMQRIIMNLISNSIKFCMDYGKVEILIKEYSEEVKVIICDNGIGMDDEFIKQAFSRYSMGRNNNDISDKGTGIGLFVVKKMVEEQGGKIEILKNVNIGTRIELTFKKVKSHE